MYHTHVGTSVHLPKDLLEEIDRRAAEEGLSRNRYIVEALRASIERETAWSPRLLNMIAEAAEDEESGEAVEKMLQVISSARTRKDAPSF